MKRCYILILTCWFILAHSYAREAKPLTCREWRKNFGNPRSDTGIIVPLINLYNYHFKKSVEANSTKSSDNIAYFSKRAVPFSEHKNNHDFLLRSCATVSKALMQNKHPEDSSEYTNKAIAVFSDGPHKLELAKAHQPRFNSKRFGTIDEIIHLNKKASQFYFQPWNVKEEQVDLINDISSLRMGQGKMQKSQDELKKYLRFYPTVGANKFQYLCALSSTCNNELVNFKDAFDNGFITIRIAEELDPSVRETLEIYDYMATKYLVKKAGKYYGQMQKTNNNFKNTIIIGLTKMIKNNMVKLSENTKVFIFRNIFL